MSDTNAANGPAVLKVRDLELAVPGRALVRDGRFIVRAGECIGLTGQNGVGKTTLMQTLAGRALPAAGTIEYGRSILDAPSGWRNGIGFMTADLVAPGALSVTEFLDVLAAARGLTSSNRTQMLADAVGLTAQLNQAIMSLSTGQKKKLGFVAALQHSPPLLLCDEPFEGLDEESANQVACMIGEFVETGGSAVVCTHRIRFIGSVAHRILTIRDEKVHNEAYPRTRDRSVATGLSEKK